MIVVILLTLVVAAVIWPVVTLVQLGMPPSVTGTDHTAIPGGLWHVVQVGLGWSVAAALGAIVVGWLPGAALARGGGRAHGAVGWSAALLVLPVLFPPHVHFWLWWQMWGPDVAWFDWIRRLEWESHARHATLWLGLVSWSWPIGAVCIAASLREAPASVREQLRLDGAGPLRRALFDLRTAWRGLLAAGLIVMLFTFNNTTCFDLSQVRTLGYELRAMDSIGAPAGAIIRLGWPAYVLAIMCVGTLAWLWSRGAPGDESSGAAYPGGPGRAGRIIALPFVLLTLLPVGMLLLWRGGELLSSASLRGYEGPLLNTVLFGVFGGMAGAVVALGVGMAASGGGSAPRSGCSVGAACVRLDLPGRVALGATCVLALAGAIPATTMAVGMIHTFNRGWAQGVIYATPVVIVLMLLARFGFVGAIIGLWSAASENVELRDLRRLDGAQTLRGLWQAGRPRWIGAAVVTLFVTATLSIGEVEAVWRVQPPRYPMIAPILLNNMHYQRDDVVLLSIVVLLGAGAAAALVVGGAIRLRPGPLAPSWLLIAASGAVALSGCRADPMESRPLTPVLVFGEPGEILGQFNYPRAIAADPLREVLYIIDRSGRVQRFGVDGKAQKQWLMPAFDNGFPTGVTVAPDGRIFVADTHEYRVAIFDGEGNLLETFGEFGSGPGQFKFVCDVAFGPDGRIYVAEFGGNDRIQVFDAGGTFLFQFGSFGAGPGEFNRPQSICFNADGTELWVADACNHRLQVFDPEGRFLRTVGGIGTGLGEFRYPYGITVMSDGSLLVCEFGNNRLQVLDAAGTPTRILGQGGSGEGQLLAPWGAVQLAGRTFVLDSRNNRVQVIESPQG